MSRPFSSRFFTGSPLFLLLGCLLACSEPEEVVQRTDPGVRSVSLELVGERAEPRTEAEVWSTLAFADGGWTLLEGPAGEIRDGRLLLTGAKSRRLTRAVELPALSFQRLRLRASSSEPELIGLVFEQAASEEAASEEQAGDERALRVASVPLFPGEEELLFDLPDPVRGDLVYDQLTILVEGESTSLELESLDLLTLPPEGLLPATTEESWLVVGEDARRGHVLRSGETWRGRIRTSTKDRERLLLSLGLPNRVRRESGAKLEVSLSCGELRRTERLPLDSMPTSPAIWRSLPLALGADGEPWLGAEVELELRLVGGPDAIVALETPLVDSPEKTPPVVLLVTSDTHRADHFSAASERSPVETPTLDWLAGRGVLFEDVLSTSNYTIPSHAALLTGEHPGRTRVISNSDSLAEQASTLAEAFRSNGFVCLASVSAAHLEPVRSGLGQGFQRFSTPVRSQRDCVPTIRALQDWVGELGGRPLFVWLHLFDAHTPYLPPRPMMEGLYPEDRDPRDPALPWPPDNQRPSWSRSVRDTDYLLASYGGEVRQLDRRLGSLLREQAFRRCLVAVTADHGESLGEQDVWFTHEPMSRASLAVPLVIAGSGVPEDMHGVQMAGATRQLDLGRTLLDLAGLAATEFPGRNLLAGSPGGPRYAIAAHSRAATIEQDGWLLVLHLVAHTSQGGEELERHQARLFELGTDPRCERDLASTRPEKLRELRGRLVGHLTGVEDLGWASGVPPGALQRGHMRALGYADGMIEEAEEGWIDPTCGCSWCLEARKP